MSYIAPNSTIILLGNVPLDKTYDHTIRWGSLSSQTTYFVSSTTHNLKRHVLSNQSYQRVNKNTLKVEYTANDTSAHGSIYSYNYLAFKNTSYENKYFYAFINKVDYVNNDVYEITYEIDVMQTWYFDYDVDEVFIERENVKDDTVGNNLVDENIDIGDYVFGVSKFYPVIHEQTGSTPPCYFVIMATTDSQGEPVVSGRLYNSTVYNGLNYITCSTTTEVENTINNIISSGAGSDAIVGIYQVPADYILQFNPSDTHHRDAFHGYLEYTDTNRGENNVDGYTPVNKKLLTYPYNCLIASNNCGDNVIYRYEFFPNLTTSSGTRRVIRFEWYANALSGCTIVYVPCYKNTGFYFASPDDFSNAIKVNATQMCSWVNDFWKAYEAQHLNRSIVEALSVSADVALAVGGYGSPTNTITSNDNGSRLTSTSSVNNASFANGVVGSLSNYGGYMAKMLDYKRFAPTAHAGSDINTLYINQKIGLKLTQQCITSNYARRIDRYFSKYGYKIKDVKIPAVFTNNRCDHWNFIQTVGCTLTGSVPNDDLSVIATIYDKGITFWENPDYIGNYSHYSWKCDSSR